MASRWLSGIARAFSTNCLDSTSKRGLGRRLVFAPAPGPRPRA
jgi:hypothetical protein